MISYIQQPVIKLVKVNISNVWPSPSDGKNSH